MESVTVLQENPKVGLEENKEPSPTDHGYAELEGLSKDLEDLSAKRGNQKAQHEEVRELIWRKGLELKVELERLKRLKDAIMREMKEADKSHRTDCVWARKEILDLEQKVIRYQDASATLQKKRGEQQKQHQEESQLAAEKIKSLKGTLQELKRSRLEIEAEKKKHMAACKAARKQVLQLQGEIEELKREMEEQAEDAKVDPATQALASQLVEAEIHSLQQEKDELLKQKERPDAAVVEDKKRDQEENLVRKVRLQLHHEVEELKTLLAEQKEAKERETQRHLRRCKAARREVLKLQHELQELRRRKNEGQKEMEGLAQKHAVDEGLSNGEVVKLRQELDQVQVKDDRSSNAGLREASSCGSLASEGLTSSPARAAMTSVGGAGDLLSRQASLAVDALEDLMAEEEFQRVLAEMSQSCVRQAVIPEAREKVDQLESPDSHGSDVAEMGGSSNVERRCEVRDSSDQEPLLGVAIASTSTLCSPPTIKSA